MAEVEDDFESLQPVTKSITPGAVDGPQLMQDAEETNDNSAGFEPTFGIEEVEEQMKEAQKHMRSDNYQQAISILYRCLSLLVEKYGETALECADAYAAYGVALMGQARKEASLLGDGEGEGSNGSSTSSSAAAAGASSSSSTAADSNATGSAMVEDEDEEDEEEREFQFVRGAGAPAVAAQKSAPAEPVGESTGDDGEETGEGKKENIQDLELSMENLEVARSIFAKHADLVREEIKKLTDQSSSSSSSSGGSEEDTAAKVQELEAKLHKLEMSLADVCEALGEAGMEAETWEQALTDLNTCLTIRSRLCAPNSRRLASVHNLLGLYYSVQSQPRQSIIHYKHAIASLTNYLASSASSVLTAAGRVENGVKKLSVPTLYDVVTLPSATSTGTSSSSSSSSASSSSSSSSSTESTIPASETKESTISDRPQQPESTSQDKPKEQPKFSFEPTFNEPQPEDFFAYIVDPKAPLRLYSNDDGEKLISSIKNELSTAVAMLTMNGDDVSAVKAARGEVDEIFDLRRELLERISDCEDEIKAGITSAEDAKRVKGLVQKVMQSNDTPSYFTGGSGTSAGSSSSFLSSSSTSAPGASTTTIGFGSSSSTSTTTATASTAPKAFVWNPPASSGSTEGQPVHVPQVKRKLAPTSAASSTTNASSTSSSTVGDSTQTTTQSNDSDAGQKRVKLDESQ